MPLVNERIFDTSRRSYLPVEMDRLAHNKLMAQPVICVGEVHTDLSHHRAQLEILKVRRAEERRSGLVSRHWTGIMGRVAGVC